MEEPLSDMAILKFHPSHHVSSEWQVILFEPTLLLVINRGRFLQYNLVSSLICSQSGTFRNVFCDGLGYARKWFLLPLEISTDVVKKAQTIWNGYE